MAESRKSSKKIPENRKKHTECARKPENAILESRKVGKKSAESRKKHIFSAENRKETPYYPPSKVQIAMTNYPQKTTISQI